MGLSEFLLVSAGVKLLVDIVRRFWPTADATVTNILAFLLGYAATYVPDVGVFTGWGSRANAAIIIGGVSSVVSELTKALRAYQKSRDVPAELLR